MDWLSSLSDLLKLGDNIKLSFPGVLFAAVLVVMLWPPNPVDVIPVVGSNTTNFGSAIGAPVQTVLAGEAPCQVNENYLEELPSGVRAIFVDRIAIAKQRQFALEQESENLDRCLAEEKRLTGVEASAKTNLQRDLTTAEAARDASAGHLAEDERVGSPLLSYAQSRYDAANARVWDLRKKLAAKEQSLRNREWEVGELTRWKAWVNARLADPGRLRPVLGFDDFLKALSGHLLAFIFLSVAAGILAQVVITPGTLDALDSFLWG
jgi:hypothetical protein